MLYNLSDVFNQAVEDSYASHSVNEGYESILAYGVKIIKDDETGSIIILNTMKGGSHYKPLDVSELKVFQKNGWRYGVYVLSLSNYRTKLLLVENRVKAEVNGGGSKKRVAKLQANREKILRKYTEVNIKLNKLK
tara:strand:- start:1438 stop:1842 length:405 start_codon:yes stop_codon:yes gene_type:complete